MTAVTPVSCFGGEDTSGGGEAVHGFEGGKGTGCGHLPTSPGQGCVGGKAQKALGPGKETHPFAFVFMGLFSGTLGKSRLSLSRF